MRLNYVFNKHPPFDKTIARAYEITSREVTWPPLVTFAFQLRFWNFKWQSAWPNRNCITGWQSSQFDQNCVWIWTGRPTLATFLETPSFRGASSTWWPSVSATFLTSLFPSRGQVPPTQRWHGCLCPPQTWATRLTWKKRKKKEIYKYKSYKGPSQVGVLLWNSSSFELSMMEGGQSGGLMRSPQEESLWSFVTVAFQF